MDSNDVFQSIKSNGLYQESLTRDYPDQPLPYGPSPLCYWTKPLSNVYREFLKTSVKSDGLYLELGSFFGCGSTRDVLEVTSMKCICVDNFSIPHTYWGPNQRRHHRPQSNPPGQRLNKMPYFQGKGTHLDHFMNNTWQYRDRIVPVQCMTDVSILEALRDAGVYPDLIFVDDDHEYEAVAWRLEFIAHHWPDALVVCDDHTESWPGVIQAVSEVLDHGLFSAAKSGKLGPRLYKLQKESTGAKTL